MIMRDVNAGYILRYTHANVASFFFIFVYAHIARGLFYSSYKTPRTLVWTIGVIIFIVMVATAFLGYKYSPKWSKFNINNQKLFKYNNKKNFIVNNNKFLIQKRNLSNITNLLSSIPFSKVLKINLNGKSKVLVNFILEHKLTPVYSYEDLHLNEIRNQILRETKGLSGIYLILNKVTLDYYIGSASTGRFFARFSNHLIYFRGSKVLKNAVRKYKLSNFSFLILELFPEVVNKDNNKNLIDREDFYLKTLLPNYNILTEAGSSFGYKHTEIERIKMKTNYSLERRIKIGNLNKGKNLSIETRTKMRERALSRDRTKINLSEKSLLNMKKSSKPLILFNLDLTIFGEYKSITEAAKAINCKVKTIRRALTTDKKLLKRRFIVKYANK